MSNWSTCLAAVAIQEREVQWKSMFLDMKFKLVSIFLENGKKIKTVRDKQNV